jgi:hypothetical protein
VQFWSRISDFSDLGAFFCPFCNPKPTPRVSKCGEARPPSGTRALPFLQVQIHIAVLSDCKGLCRLFHRSVFDPSLGLGGTDRARRKRRSRASSVAPLERNCSPRAVDRLPEPTSRVRRTEGFALRPAEIRRPAGLHSRCTQPAQAAGPRPQALLRVDCAQHRRRGHQIEIVRNANAPICHLSKEGKN